MCLGTLAEAGVVKDAELAVQILWCVLPVNGHLALGRAIRQLEGPFQKFNPKEGGKNNSKIPSDTRLVFCHMLPCVEGLNRANKGN